MTDNINLVLPEVKYTKQLKELKKNGLDDSAAGIGRLKDDSVEEWIKRCEDNRQGKNLPEGYVPATQFLAIRENDNKLVGLLQIRHELNDDLLLHGGHIGYMVPENERRKGYATLMLKLALPECKKLNIHKVLITCKKGNIASAKVIIANGGVFENEIEWEGDLLQRYWIKQI